MISGEIEFTLKRAFILSKLKSWQIVVISNLYTLTPNFSKIPAKYIVNTQLKLKNNFCPSLSWTFKQKPKLVYKKTLYIWATNLGQSRKFYTTGGCDG